MNACCSNKSITSNLQDFGACIKIVTNIDPPYNTLNEDFIYDDKLIAADDLYRHSKWLSFMKKRLLIAKKLLANVGFISCRDQR